MVNALFSGLAFLGVIVAILLQREELKLQREELAQTREELRRQGEALEAQVSAVGQQRFDSTFFQMISLHHQIVESVDVWYKRSHRGREGLDRMFSLVTDKMPDVGLPAEKPSDLQKQVQAIAAGYRQIYDALESEVGHYFRNLYRIVKFVDEGEVEHKATYTGILRAQLSTREMGLLFYNLFGPGFEKFLPLAERYDLLANLPVDLIQLNHLEIINRYRGATAGPDWKRLVLENPSDPT